MRIIPAFTVYQFTYDDRKEIRALAVRLKELKHPEPPSDSTYIVLRDLSMGYLQFVYTHEHIQSQVTSLRMWDRQLRVYEKLKPAGVSDIGYDNITELREIIEEIIGRLTLPNGK